MRFDLTGQRVCPRAGPWEDRCAFFRRAILASLLSRGGPGPASVVLVLECPPEKVRQDVFNVGDTRENYTKQMIVDEILKCLHDVVAHARNLRAQKRKNPRDYRVDFSKIQSKLGFQITKNGCQTGFAKSPLLLRQGIISLTPDAARFKNVLTKAASFIPLEAWPVIQGNEMGFMSRNASTPAGSHPPESLSTALSRISPAFITGAKYAVACATGHGRHCTWRCAFAGVVAGDEVIVPNGHVHCLGEFHTLREC